jgi:hypothetical protein
MFHSIGFVGVESKHILKALHTGFIPPRGNYRQLLSYRKAEIVFDITYHFCQRFLAKSDRTIDQMI